MTYRELIQLVEKLKALESVVAELHVGNHNLTDPIPEAHLTRVKDALGDLQHE